MKPIDKNVKKSAKVAVKRRYIIVGILAMIGIGFWVTKVRYFPGKVKGAQNYAVTLGDTGFEPTTLTIKQEDSVTFTSKRGKPFWPASDLHPTHELYPQFDPKRPIDA